MEGKNTSQDVILLEKIKSELGQYDYVRFVFSDISGVSRGKLVPVRHAAAVLEDGLACSAGALTWGPNTKRVSTKRLVKINHGDMQLVPDLRTLHPIPWISDGKYKFAEMIVNNHWLDDMTPQRAAPRFVALHQLEKLDKLGLKLYSAAELEFSVADKAIPPKPLFRGNMYSSSLLLSKYGPWLAEVDRNMKEAGVDIKLMHTEFAPGQFEVSTTPRYGIEGADLSFTLKQGIKEMADQKGWIANLLAVPWLGKVGSWSHFNFSLWEKDSNRNVFWDETSPNGFSKLAHHWLAGMLKHANALTALCCSSTNCYKRPHAMPCLPTVANWGRQNRSAMVRVKAAGPPGTYMENRLPTGVASPYLVMAATVAAGLDGVTNHLECPPEHSTENAAKLPTTLEQALECLKQDTEMVSALGEEFVEWFVQVKQEADLQAVANLTDPEQIQAKEYEQYALYA